MGEETLSIAAASSPLSFIEHMSKADLVVIIDYMGDIEIVKNRYGNRGKIGLSDLIKILIDKSDDPFTGSKLLDTTVKNDLIKAIGDVMNKYNL